MKKQLLPILFAALSLGLAACGNGGSSSTTPSSEQTSSEAGGSSSQSQSQSQTSSEAATVASIALGGTYQTEYYLNDGFNPDGLVVTATMSDGTTKVIDEDEYEVSGFDSTTTGVKSVTISYGGKSGSFTVTINPEPTYTVAITVTVSGIDDYSDFHEAIYMNSDALGSATEWGTQKLTQDTTDPNKWTIEIADLKAGSYDYNFIYGTNDAPNWNTYAKNILEDEAQYRSFNVSSDAELGLTAQFTVPEFIYKNITLKLTPSVVTSYGADPVGLNDDVYLWMWDSIDNTEVLLDKQSDGSWTRDLSVPLNVTTEEGQIKYTATLSSSSEAAQWVYQQGNYSVTDNTWESWHDITIDVNSDSETIQVGAPVFNGQPEPIANPYKLTINVTFGSGSSTIPGLGLKVGSDTVEWTSGCTTWVDNLNDAGDEDPLTFSISEYESAQGTFTFFLEGWNELKFSITPDGSWHAYKVVIPDTATTAVVNLTIGDVTEAKPYAGTVSSSTGCTVTIAG